MGNTDVYFYVLLELQSRVDFIMPFRLLKYTTGLLDYIFNNTDEKIRERKDFKFPAIVPIIFYNGGDNWTAAGSFRECTENHDIFGNILTDVGYLLFDLNRMSEDKILSTKKLLDLIFMFDKRRLEIKDIMEVIKPLPEWSSELADDALSELCRWVACVLSKGKVTPELEENLKNYLKKGDGTTMKYALDTWLDEREEQAKKEGSLEIARKMKDMGMSVNDIVTATGLTVDEVLKFCP
jgi:predicted transposase/invertase (TIGR01784 family)